MLFQHELQIIMHVPYRPVCYVMGYIHNDSAKDSVKSVLWDQDTYLRVGSLLNDSVLICTERNIKNGLYCGHYILDTG